MVTLVNSRLPVVRADVWPLQLASVGLDVFPNEPHVNPRLLEFPFITLVPHMGTETQDTQKKMEIRALTNLRDYLTVGQGKDVVTEMKGVKF